MCKFKRYLECLDLFIFLICLLYHYLHTNSTKKNERGNKVFSFIPGLKSEVFPFTLIKLIPKIEALNRYLDMSIEDVQERIRKSPDDAPRDWETLNDLFLSQLY